MGGGSGGQKTESKAEYPEEFKPLAESARKQIEALQNALPLVSHAQFQPAGVAGLSPVEQFAIEELVMRTPYLPASFQSLMDLPEPVGAASQGAVRAGQGSKGAAGALDYLSGFLGRDVRPAPPSTLPFQTLTKLPMPETAFPGLTRETLEAARPGIATRMTPMIQPNPSPPPVGPMVAPPAIQMPQFAPPEPPVWPGGPTLTQLLQVGINPNEVGVEAARLMWSAHLSQGRRGGGDGDGGDASDAGDGGGDDGAGDGGGDF